MHALNALGESGAAYVLQALSELLSLHALPAEYALIQHYTPGWTYTASIERNAYNAAAASEAAMTTAPRPKGALAPRTLVCV